MYVVILIPFAIFICVPTIVIYCLWLKGRNRILASPTRISPILNTNILPNSSSEMHIANVNECTEQNKDAFVMLSNVTIYPITLPGAHKEICCFCRESGAELDKENRSLYRTFCGHFMCRECIQNYHLTRKAEKKQFECPICRTVLN